MARRFPLFMVILPLAAALSTNEVTKSSMTVLAMEKVFLRSELAHQEHMAAITRIMTIPKAVDVLHKHKLDTPGLVEATNLALVGTGSHLRKQPKGYSGIDGARKLLNDMIFESMTKYDEEIAKCTEYYSKQCAAMDACRSKIAAANYVAANSRALILDAQSTISKCEIDIPTTKLELKQHNLKCAHELHEMNARLKIVEGDIQVMTMILEMTDCEKKLLQTHQLALLHCEDGCSKKSFIKFEHDGLQKKVSQLQSSSSRNLMKETFADLFSGITSLEGTEFLQTRAVQEPEVANKTQFNTPPMPRTEVPLNPCTDPFQGAPSASDKAAAKCTIKKSPQCYKLQERFLLIQSGIMDERDNLENDIDRMERSCEETKTVLENQIQQDEDMLANAQTKLAGATEKEADAGEIARNTNEENSQLNEDLMKQMKTCSGNYINFETEMCALKKIRGELYKMQGSGHSSFFQDCEVSKWGPEECSKKCKGGEQKLTRSVLTHPNGGAKCLPLEAMRSCNTQPCPVDCKLKTWSGWSKCSAECGGGVQQRLREVKRAMRYNGEPCGKTSETKACNAQACERDCELGPWTKWSMCSKDCDGGTRKREKFVQIPAAGAGTCADPWDSKRLEYKHCAMHRCHTPAVLEPLHCNRSLDVVLLIDGSGSLGKAGWNAEIKAARTFVDAFANSGKANLAVILYSGPRTWAGVKKCVGKSAAKVDQEDVCKIKSVTHFTDDMKKVKQLITGLDWPQGSTLTSLALMTAKAELMNGRKTAPPVVIVFTDGRPLSYGLTGMASMAVRKVARLVWVPITRFAPLKYIKLWATRRWQENVIPVKDFKKLSDQAVEVITHIVADICPEEKPKEPEFPMDDSGGASLD